MGCGPSKGTPGGDGEIGELQAQLAAAEKKYKDSLDKLSMIEKKLDNIVIPRSTAELDALEERMKAVQHNTHSQYTINTHTRLACVVPL